MPRIDRKANGKPINLGAYSTAFTRDDIMNEHGSGVYRIDLNQTDPASSRSRRVAREVFTIINPKYPPIVPPGDWVDDKVNDMWKWGAPAGVSNAGIAAGYPPGFNIENVMERQEKGLKMGLEMAKALTPPPVPAKDDSALITLLTELIKNNKPEPKDDKAMSLVIELLRADLKEAREEMREMRKNAVAPAPANNILQQVKELRPMITEFAEIFAEKSGNMPWWQGPLEKLVESIPDVIDLVKTGQQQHAPTPVQWNPAAIAAPQTQTVVPPPPPPPSATAAATAPQPEQPSLTDQQKQMQALFQKWGGFVLFIAPQMIEHFKTENGFAFRDWFLRGHGLFKWADMRRELGPEILSSMIAQHPALSVEISPPEARELFFRDFFEPIPDDDDDDDDEEVPVINIGDDDAA
jgi:hypothetical protein